METLCLGGGGGSAKETGQLHRIKGMMDRAMYRQDKSIEASQGTENGSWMGISAYNDPKHTAKATKEWLKMKHIKGVFQVLISL